MSETILNTTLVANPLLKVVIASSFSVGRIHHFQGTVFLSGTKPRGTHPICNELGLNNMTERFIKKRTIIGSDAVHNFIL